jgi:protein-disulfide isomerase
MQEQKMDKVCANSIFFGNKNARVRIRIFSDLNCGYCMIASEKYRQIFNNDPTTTIEFIYYPINHRKDNKKDSLKIDTFLYRVMFTASHDKDFWKFHDQIINQPVNLDSAKVFKIAEKSLKNFSEFKHIFSIGSQNYSLEENILLAEDYGIQGTPTIFINGREFKQWTNISLLKTIISAISKKKNLAIIK